MDGNLIDASQASVPAGKSTSAVFDLENTTSGILELRAGTSDQLSLDDVSWAAINPPRRAAVLLVSATPDEPLTFGLQTEIAQKLGDVTIQGPAYLKSDEYQQYATAGDYDLVIYDRCQPPRMPQSNTLFIGVLPPPPTDWQAEAKADVPQIIDTDRTHPLMQFVEMGDVIISEAMPLKPPAGSTVLIHSSAGPLFAIAPGNLLRTLFWALNSTATKKFRPTGRFAVAFPFSCSTCLNTLAVRRRDNFVNQTSPPASPQTCAWIRLPRL